MPPFANFHVRKAPLLPPLVQHLRELKALPAYVCSDETWTTLYPSIDESPDGKRVERLVHSLSSLTGSAVVGLLVEPGLRFRFWLSDDGEKLASYDTDDRPDLVEAGALLPYCAPGTTEEAVHSLLRDQRTQLQEDTTEFLRVWNEHRRTVRDHILKTYPQAELTSLLREFDHHSSQMSSADAPSEVGELAADFGRLLGLRDDLSRLGFRDIDGGTVPRGSTVRLD